MSFRDENRRNFNSIAVSSSLKGFFDSIPNTILTPYLYDLGASFTLLGSFRALPSMISLISSRFWGAISDSMERRKPFILLSFLLSIPFFLAYAFIADSPRDFLIIRVISSFFSLEAGILPATIASTSTRLGRAFGDYSFATSAAWTSGGMFSGWFVEHYSINAAFLLGSLGTIIASTIFLFTYQEVGERKVHRIDPRKIVLKTISFDLNPKAWKLTILSVFTALRSAFFGLPAVMKMYILLGRSKTIYTIVLSFAGLAGIITSPLYGRAVDRFGARKSAITSLSAYMIYLPLMALTNSPFLFAVLWAIPIGNLEYAALMSLKVKVSNPKGRATDIGTIQAISSLFAALGNVAAGALVDHLDIASSLFIATLFDVMALILMLRMSDFVIR